MPVVPTASGHKELKMQLKAIRSHENISKEHGSEHGNPLESIVKIKLI